MKKTPERVDDPFGRFFFSGDPIDWHSGNPLAGGKPGFRPG